MLFPVATTRSIARVASPARGVSISHGTWMACSFPKKPTQHSGTRPPPKTELEGGGHDHPIPFCILAIQSLGHRGKREPLVNRGAHALWACAGAARC